MAGDTITGVQVMKMDVGLDTGPVMMTATTPIREDDTTGDVHDRLAVLGAELMVEALAALEAGPVNLIAAGRARASPSPRRSRQRKHGSTGPSRRRQVAAHIRGLSPFPGAWFELDGQRIKALHARAETGSGEPGDVIDESLLVACGEGAVRITRLQRAGKGQMTADEFQRGARIAQGRRLS